MCVNGWLRLVVKNAWSAQFTGPFTISDGTSVKNIKWMSRCIVQVLYQVLVGFLFSISKTWLSFLLQIVFRPTPSFLLHLYSFHGCFFKETLHTMLRYAKLSAKRSLGMTLLIQKYNFMSVKLSLAFFCRFNERNGNKWFEWVLKDTV